MVMMVISDSDSDAVGDNDSNDGGDDDYGDDGDDVVDRILSWLSLRLFLGGILLIS